MIDKRSKRGTVTWIVHMNTRQTGKKRRNTLNRTTECLTKGPWETNRRSDLNRAIERQTNDKLIRSDLISPSSEVLHYCVFTKRYISWRNNIFKVTNTSYTSWNSCKTNHTFSGPCYLARCDMITERVWVYVKCIHWVISTAYKNERT